MQNLRNEISAKEFDEWKNSRVTKKVEEVLKLGISLSLERKAQKGGTALEIGEYNLYQQGGIDTARLILEMDGDFINATLEVPDEL